LHRGIPKRTGYPRSNGLNGHRRSYKATVEEGAAFGGHVEEPKSLAVLVTAGDLFNAAVFEVVRQSTVESAQS
jgi:hypothetical protein